MYEWPRISEQVLAKTGRVEELFIAEIQMHRKFLDEIIPEIAF